MDKLDIPKIIHLTYKDHNIPASWKSTIPAWKKYNPDWEIRFWTDDDNRKLIETKYKWFLHTYDSYEYGIQRADAIRYFILYTYGGIYSDMDIEPTKNFDKLFTKITDQEVYLIKSPQLSYVTNCFMASKPKTKFWEDVFKEMKEVAKSPSIFWVGKHWTVMNTTGPIMINKVYRNYKNKDKVKIICSEYIVPTKCNICSRKPCKTRSSYTKLLQGSSWCNFDTKIYNCFLCNFGTIKAVIIAIILIILRHLMYILN
jgi:mannosyltransferase OCH1-like enzyme